MDFETIIQEMTLEEKIDMLSGSGVWHSTGVSRLNVPRLKVTDGPNGVRGAGSTTGPTSASFPIGAAMGATWNVGLIKQVGAALAEEVKDKSAHILLGPTVNIPRTPIAGRNFECFSEDPFLSGMIASAYIQGLQENGVGACIKHYAANDQEHERFSISSEVSKRALHEIYLEPFRIAVARSNPWSIMSAYNRINGVYASEHDYLLTEVLRDTFGFDGVVISDWYGTYTPRLVASGLDLEMPGPARWMGEKALEMVTSGKVDESWVDAKVMRLLKTLSRVGAFENPEQPERSVDRVAHRKLIRKVGGEAIVLLKNEDEMLPLDPEKKQTLAVIGPSAHWTMFQGGGSSQVNPHYVVSPLEAIREVVGEQVEVKYAVGTTIHKELPTIENAWMTADDGTQGHLTIKFYGNAKLEGDPVHQDTTPRMAQSWFGDTAEYVDPSNFSLRMSGSVTFPKAGTYELSLGCVGRARLLLDGEERISIWEDRSSDVSPWETTEKRLMIDVDTDQTMSLLIEYSSEYKTRWRMIRLGCMPPLADDLMGEAEALAKNADAVLVLAGLGLEGESEGFDRATMRLTGNQDELIARMIEANSNTIVALNVGSPVEMPWLSQVKAVMQIWYLGQETGHALADVLFGRVNPSGKLPVTIPKKLEDNPAFINYPGENGKVMYGEGLFVGYRYYDKKRFAPQFAFGHGLSYTEFTYSDLQLTPAQFTENETVDVQCTITNTGKRAGQEIVQVYVRDLKSHLVRPEKELKAFIKVSLEPGEKTTVVTTLGREAFAYYDDMLSEWVVEPGVFEVWVGSAADDIRLVGSVTLVDDAGNADTGFHIGMTLGELLTDDRSKAVLETYLGELLSHPQLSMAMVLPFRDLARTVPQYLPTETIQAISADLAKIAS